MIELTTTTLVLLGTAVLGLNAGVVGVFTVLRKRSLVGDAIAHAALPGVCVAYFFVHDRNFVAFLLGALVFGLLASATITFIHCYRYYPRIVFWFGACSLAHHPERAEWKPRRD